MELMRRILLISLFFTTISCFAQKKVIDASVYNDWKRVGDIQISADGKFSVYSVKPHRGDGYLYLVNNETGKRDSIARGTEPQFSGKSTFLVFKIPAGFDTLRKVELEKVAKDKWPKDSLCIWFLNDTVVKKIANVKEYKLGTDSDWLAYLSGKNEFPKNYLSKKEKRKEAKSIKKNGPVKTDGKLLAIWHPEQKKPVYYKNVTSFEVSKNGSQIAFTDHQNYKKADSVRLNVYSTANSEIWKNNRRYTDIPQLSFGTSERYLTGLYTTDTSEQKRWNAYLFDCPKKEWTTFIDTSMRFETNRVVTNNYKLRVSRDEQQVYFGAWDIPDPEVKDTLLESEKVKLDLWHWKDARMQPQQLVELKEDEARSNIQVYHIADKRFVQLGQDSLRMRIPVKGTVPYVLATGAEAYEWQTWKMPLPSNYYRISTASGEIVPLKYGVVHDTWLSPEGRYFVYYNEKTKQLYAMDVDVETETCLTCTEKINWYEDVNGMPVIPAPLGIIGWSDKENGVLIQAEHGIWYYNFEDSKLKSVTAALTKDTNYAYTFGSWSADSVYLSPENLYLVQLNKKTKAENVYQLGGTFREPSFTLLAGSDHHYGGFKRAKNAPAILFQRNSVIDYPDVMLLSKAGAAPQRLSFANPQQSQYNWATAELIEWTSYEGIPLQGIVYKPENFDPNEEYPMIVYYYELYSDELHNHYAPRPTASVIFPTEYASAGYVVFFPDIRYKPGHPANSAYDCIMSGTDAVLKKYSNIDPKRLGLQGQSWGGYQTAQLVTMTDRYAAAMAGAPVSNMFSAYGGIRWGSGYSRQFQYEHSQSRIGKTIWEAPELYIENSPIFHLPKVKTPLLIMANDQDGAVPWYQGIELYTGLRRLQKPVWLLNYNGDDHNLMRNANRIDLSIRMRQFFDYYLLGEPIPLWLKEGIPAIEKGKEFKLKTVE